MSNVSIRLPDDVERRLAEEAQRTRRGKSEIARVAIIHYLERQERERFLADIARAARVRRPEETLELAEEALPLDNEALQVSEGSSPVHEPKANVDRSGRTSDKAVIFL
jgi:predicted transcriptional regulator